jgi:hypothetical protein
MTGHTTEPAGARRLDRGLIGGLLLALGLLALAGPFLLPRLARLGAPPDAGREVIYSIPPGTAEVIKSGGDPKIVPAEMVFTLGLQDVLVIHNNDLVGHTFGPYWVAAHNTLRVQFSQPAEYEGYCSVHPSNQVKIIVQNRPAS